MDNKKALIVLIVAFVVIAVGTIVFLSTNNTTANVTYTVTFAENDGTVISTQKVEQGDKLSMPSKPTKEGYVFVGWTYQGKTYDFSSAVTSNITLQAKWQEVKEDVVTYIVSFDSDGGTTIENQIVEKDAKADKPTDPVKEGYKFVEWTLNSNTYDFTIKVVGNITLVAKYEKLEDGKKEENKPVNKTENGSSNQNSSTNSNNNKNETSSNSSLKTPVLSYPSGSDMPGYGETTTDGVYIYDLSVNNEDYYIKENDKYTVDGFEVYEKVGTEYKHIGTGKMGGVVVVEIEPGTKRTFVAKAYVLNSKGAKVYSDYSKELVIDKTKVKTPVLSYPSGSNTPGYGETTTDGVYIYDLSVNNKDYYIKENDKYTVDGFEVYEKVGTEYKHIGTGKMGGVVVVEIEPGTKRTFVAKAYVLNSKGAKVYSDYSKELAIDKTKAKTPVLSYPSGSDMPGYGETTTDGVYIYDLSVNNKDYYIKENDKYTVDGFEVYEKVGTEYKHIGTGKMGGVVVVEIEPGTKRIFVAKAYVLNSKGAKVYSDYSKELVIDKTN